MSFVTTVMLLFPSLEDCEQRIQEVNNFINNNIPINMTSVNAPNVHYGEYGAWYGGTKNVLGCVYIGSYNNFDSSAFLQHLSNSVLWENPEYVQILIRSEDEWNYNLYGNAGKQVILEAYKQ